MEDKAKDVARIDEANHDDVSRIGNFVHEDGPADPRFDELTCSAIFGVVVQLRLPAGLGQRPEIAVMVFQDLEVNQAIKSQIDDRLRTGGESFNPELGVALHRFPGNLFQNGIQGGVARFCRVYKEQGFHVRVDTRQEREFREDCTGDGAVQIPAGYLVKVTVVLVEKHQDELLGQT